MRISSFLTLALGSIGTSALLSTCIAKQQYSNIPGFPISSSGCHPVSYFSSSALGNTDATNAQSRCQQRCNGLGSRCSAVVAVLDNASFGTCYFYAQTDSLTPPNTCPDPASLLQGYFKDNTPQSSPGSVVASIPFCRSRSAPVITSTFTITPSIKSQTTTVTATTDVSTTTGVTMTVSAISTKVVSTIITESTTVATTTVTVSTAVTTSITSITTSTSTSTVTTSRGVNTSLFRRDAVAASPDCGYPTTPLRITSDFLCIKPPRSTTMEVVAAATPSTILTASTTQTNTITVTTSATTTVTDATATVTSSSTTTLSLTATSSSTITQSITTNVVSTTTVTTTTTTTLYPPLQTIRLTIRNNPDPYFSSTNGVGGLEFYSLNGGYFSRIRRKSDINPEQLFTINTATGEFKALNGPASSSDSAIGFYGINESLASYFVIGSMGTDFATGGIPLVCRVASSGKLECKWDGSEPAAFWQCAPNLKIAKPGYTLDGNYNCGFRITPYKVDVYADIIG